MDLGALIRRADVADLIGNDGAWWLWSVPEGRLLLTNAAGAHAIGMSGPEAAIRASLSDILARQTVVVQTRAALSSLTGTEARRLTLTGDSLPGGTMTVDARRIAPNLALIANVQHRTTDLKAARDWLEALPIAALLHRADGAALATSHLAGQFSGAPLGLLLGSAATGAFEALERTGRARIDLVSGPLTLVKAGAGALIVGTFGEAEPRESGADAAVVTPITATPAAAMSAGAIAPAHSAATAMPAGATAKIFTAPARLLWQTDARYVFAADPAGLEPAVGARYSELAGRSWRDVAKAYGLDADGSIAAAFASHAVWSGKRVNWPREQGGHVPVILSAIPQLDSSGSFNGYRGFGVLLAPVDGAPAAAPSSSTIPQENAPPSAQSDGKVAAPLVVHETPANVVALRNSAAGAAGAERSRPSTLSPVERNAFREIARALNARMPQDGRTDAEPTDSPDAKPLLSGTADATAAPDSATDNAVPSTAPASETPKSAASAPSKTTTALPERVKASDPKSSRHKPSAADQQPSTARVTTDASRPAAASDIPSETPPGTPFGPLPGAFAPIVPRYTEGQKALKASESPADATVDAPSAPLSTSKPAAASTDIPAVQPIGEPGSTAHQSEAAGPDLAKPDAEKPAVEKHPAPNAVHPLAIAAPSVLPVASTGAAPTTTNRTPDASVNLGFALIDRLPVGVLIHRGNAVLFANRTLLDWTGFADSSALEQAGGVARVFAGSLSEHDGPVAVTQKDGSSLPVAARLSRISFDDQPAMMFALSPETPSTSEPDHHAVAETMLAESKARLDEVESILDTATDGVVILDHTGTIDSLNRSAEALFGYESGDVKGRHLNTLLAPESHRVVSDYLDGLQSSGVASILNDGREIVGQVRQGGLIPLYMTIGRTGTAGRQRFAAVMRDLTQWKKAEEELLAARREAERASSHKSDFLAKISHEIRTPLNAIIGFSEVMLEERFGPVGNPRYKEYLHDIHVSGGHVMSLINDLLDLSKIEAGKLDLHFAAVDVNAVVQQCVSMMQPQANRERVIIRSSLAPNLPQVVADDRSIRQIILNLLSNSVKFTPPTGQVIISTALAPGGEALIRVRDTGIGMSEADIRTAMEPFRQIAPTTGKGSVAGSGLGLPLTKALVEANRASFNIASNPGQGTLIEVIFPATRVLAE